jgi:endonuclease/exonuclease/phosphatase family metal-dependent hydrolase
MKTKQLFVFAIAYFAIVAFFIASPFSPALAATPTMLRVGTYNVESSGDTNPEKVATVVQKIATSQQIDLWGLSEVLDSQAATQFANAANYFDANFAAIIGTTGGNDKLAILYNQNHLQKIGNEFELRNMGGSRDPLVAKFQWLSAGPTFLVVDNHFNRCDPDKRNAQAKNVRAWIEQQTLPIIAVGDYNFDYAIDENFNPGRRCSSYDPSSEFPQGNAAFREFIASSQIR